MSQDEGGVCASLPLSLSLHKLRQPFCDSGKAHKTSNPCKDRNDRQVIQHQLILFW